mmetsp:Transcript_71313/g.163448  ORF Transcript_71313/g.163448 Transcript_71313/m.163448 type:complete len:111 (+) Transcript_71313:1597-1929(+)
MCALGSSSTPSVTRCLVSASGRDCTRELDWPRLPVCILAHPSISGSVVGRCNLALLSRFACRLPLARGEKRRNPVVHILEALQLCPSRYLSNLVPQALVSSADFCEHIGK